MSSDNWKIRAYYGWVILNALIWTTFLFINQMEGFPTKKGILIPIALSILFSYIIFWHFVSRPVINGKTLTYGKLLFGLIPKYSLIQSKDVQSVVARIFIDTSDSVHIKKEEQAELKQFAEQKVKDLDSNKVLSKIHDSSLSIPGHSESFVYSVEYIIVEDKDGKKHKVKIKEKEIAKKVGSWLEPKTKITFDIKTEFSSSNTGVPSV